MKKGQTKMKTKVFAQDRPYNLASSKVGYVFMTYRLIYVFITPSSLKSLLPENPNSLKVDDNCSSVKHDTSSNIQHSH